MHLTRMGPFLKAMALSTLAASLGQAAPVTVTPVVTPSGSLFRFNYTITNGTGLDVPVIDINVARGTGVILNLAAPVGFLTAYDPTLGLVSFLENTAVFGATPLSGFTFDSRLPAGASSFTATFADGSAMSGATMAPVPEPTALSLFGAGGILLALRRFILKPTIDSMKWTKI